MEEYATSDIYYAAYLKCAGVTLVGTRREGSKVIFIFEDLGSVAMRSLKQGYFSDTAKVGALSFTQAVRMMKGLLFTDSPNGA